MFASIVVSDVVVAVVVIVVLVAVHRVIARKRDAAFWAAEDLRVCALLDADARADAEAEMEEEAAALVEEVLREPVAGAAVEVALREVRESARTPEQIEAEEQIQYETRVNVTDVWLARGKRWD